MAGGRALRLGGVPKGLITVRGRSCLDRLLDEAPRFAEVLLVADDARPYAGHGLRCCGDVLPGRGVPSGLHAALAHARTDQVMVVAADMPFVSGAVFGALLEAPCRPGAAVAFCVNGEVAPLPSLWGREAKPFVERALRQGAPALVALLTSVGASCLPESALRAVNPDLSALVNLNTPDELLAHGALLPR